ncbi:hypothetical protein NMY22_g14580 [Coprinellus aureogranulatus]|nr:hypothetical protein NMY22_g14580 [Coprinellus aureogranulatus]
MLDQRDPWSPARDIDVAQWVTKKKRYQEKNREEREHARYRLRGKNVYKLVPPPDWGRNDERVTAYNSARLGSRSESLGGGGCDIAHMIIAAHSSSSRRGDSVDKGVDRITRCTGSTSDHRLDAHLLARMVFGLLCLLYFNIFTIAKPVAIERNATFVAKSERSLFWGWAWGTESTVSIVDRTPPISFASRPAAFGAEINDPILGYVIPLSSFTKPCSTNSSNVEELPDNSGCPNLCLTSDHQPGDIWIALVQRGKCEFVKKVREAERLGARAVVVGGLDPDKTGYPDTLVNMYSPEDSSDVKIPATYIKYSDYMQLYTLIQASNTTHSGFRTLSLYITAEYSAWEWYSPIITFIIILLLPSTLTFVTLLIHRIRAARAAQRDRAPESIVRGLPWRVWTGTGWEKHEGGEDPDSVPTNVDLEEGPKGDDDQNASTSHPTTPPALPSTNQPWFESQQECAICLSEFAKGDKVRVLPCHHIFHLHEVDEWLIQRKKLCPVCKADVTQPPPALRPQPPTSPTSEETPRSPATSPDPRPTSRPSTPTPTERTPLLFNNSNPQPH